MDFLLRIAARVAAEDTTAGPVLDIFKDLSGKTVEKAIEKELDRLGYQRDGEAVDVLVSAVKDVYGPELAEEVDQAVSVPGGAGALTFVHELMHKIAEPGFLLSKGGEFLKVEDSTSKSLTETTVDEMLIGYLERGRVDDFDNLFTAVIDNFDTVDQFMAELENGASHPDLERVLRGAASHLRRTRPDLPGKTAEDQVKWPTPTQPDRMTSATSAAMWTVQSYVKEKIPQLAETMIAAPAEAKFKKFVNLALSRLRKLP